MFSSDYTVAILLGASAWPKSPSRFPGSDNFTNSARAFADYLGDPSGLALKPSQVLNLFDDPRPPSDIDEAVDVFLSRQAVKDVLFYYTGHGAFTEGDQRYCLPVRASRAGSLGASAYRLSSLARTLNKTVHDARKYLIIDACYAGAAQVEFLPQDDAAYRIENQTMDALADSGTALLCAASSADVALSPLTGQYTMFSGALLECLHSGSPRHQRLLSFNDLRTMVSRRIRDQFRDQSVIPEIHIPDQRKGDISQIGVFPNRAVSQDKVTVQSANERLPNEGQPSAEDASAVVINSISAAAMSRQHSPLTGELSPAGENADAGGILAIYRHKFLSALRRLAKLGKHTIATAVLLGASSYAAWLIYNDYVTKKELEDSNATINSRIASSYRIKSCSFSKKLNAMDADANGTVLVELQPGFSREMAQRFPVLVQLYEPKGGVLYEVRRVPLKVDRDYVAEPTNVTLNWKMAEAPQNFSSVSVRVDREGLPDVRCSYDRDLSAAIAPPIYRPSPFPAPAPTASGIRCTVSEKGGGQPLAVRDGPRGKDLNNNLPVGTSVEIIPDEKADEKWVYVRAAAGPANRPGLGFVFLDYLKCN